MQLSYILPLGPILTICSSSMKHDQATTEVCTRSCEISKLNIAQCKHQELIQNQEKNVFNANTPHQGH